MSGNDCQSVNVTIAVITEGSLRWLNPHIEEFQRIHPHVKINLGESMCLVVLVMRVKNSALICSNYQFIQC